MESQSVAALDEAAKVLRTAGNLLAEGGSKQPAARALGLATELGNWAAWFVMTAGEELRSAVDQVLESEAVR